MAQHTTKRNIRNPQLWIGRYVRHMANWRDFQWDFDGGYTVCEWTGDLMLIADNAYYGDYFNSLEEAEAAGYDECYYYSEKAMRDMAARSIQTAA